MTKSFAAWSRLLVSFVVLIVSSGEVLSQEQPKKDFNGSPAYDVVRVVDGDTVVLKMDDKEVKVRLIGVDTPETVHPTKQVERFGKEASAFLTNLLKNEKVYVEYEKDKFFGETQDKPETDKYDRTLAYLYRSPDGLCINLEIVKQGYGHAYTKYPFKYMELFRSAEKNAREGKKGLWADDVEAKKDDGKEEEKKAEPEKKEDQKTDEVYVTATGKKYHKAGCRYLTDSQRKISLTEAKSGGYEPCKVCGGSDDSKAKEEPSISPPKEEKKPDNEVAGTCGATTKKGTPCKRKVKGGGRCWQHQ